MGLQRSFYKSNLPSNVREEGFENMIIIGIEDQKNIHSTLPPLYKLPARRFVE